MNIFYLQSNILLCNVLIKIKSTLRRRYIESKINRMRDLSFRSKIKFDVPRYYSDYLSTYRWDLIKFLTFKALDNKCELCGKQAEHVHHIYYPKNKTDLGLESIASLCLVCGKCHNVLHGMDVQNNKNCPLCEKRVGDKQLTILYKHYDKNHQSVCKRCKLIATGYRDKANKWSALEYDIWINNWQDMLLTTYAKVIKKRI